MKSFSCVLEPDMDAARKGGFYLRGQWGKDFFKNDRPIVLELGCGKGEYTVELARKNPKQNFIGVDVKGARIWRGAKTVHVEQLPNAAFLRTKIEFVDTFFAPSEVDEIWLTFSDPQPKDRKGTKRLTGSPFLERYRRILRPEGVVHLKTDSAYLHRATLETLEDEGLTPEVVCGDIYGREGEGLESADREILGIKTFYERKFLAQGKKITYIRFQVHGHSTENIAEEQRVL